MSVTQTRTVRARARTLSLIAPRGGPSFATLPVELTLDILELVLLSSASASSGISGKSLPSYGRQQSVVVTLATISRYITTLLNQILYRSVVLSTPRAVSLFARTVRSKDPSFFTAQVKRLSITAQTTSTRPLASTGLFTAITRENSRSRDSVSSNDDLQAILAACSSAKTLVLPEHALQSFFTLPLSSQSQSQSRHITPSELTLGSLSDIHPWMSSPSGHASEVLDNLTHLRLAEPGHMFVSPSSFMTALGPLPHLTHLHLNRRASANEDNDIAFVQDCEDVLRQKEGLKMLVVSVFLPFYYSMTAPSSLPAGGGADEDAEMREMDEEKAREATMERECVESSLWRMLQDLKAKDERLVIIQGQQGAWRKEWEGVLVIANATGAGDFWVRAKQRATARARKTTN